MYYLRMDTRRIAEARDRLMRQMVPEYDTLSPEQMQLLNESVSVDANQIVITPPSGATGTVRDDRRTATYTRDGVSIVLPLPDEPPAITGIRLKS